MTRARARDLGATIGVLPVGTYNAITDVPGVRVGHSTIIADTPRVARTGVTVIFPRAEPIWEYHTPAGFHVLNGNGDFTGTHWIEESGLLTSLIAITNTHQVGMVRDEIVRYSVENGVREWVMPLVGETYDGWLNDISAFHVQPHHVREAIANASSGAVPEGNVGGGTGMICYDFKGGIGTSSRIASTSNGDYVVGALVQANHGDRHLLRADGVSIGRAIPYEHTPSAWDEPQRPGSIIVIIATNAPLIPTQCKRLAQRATIGLARSGGNGHNGSGDLFLAFATGNHVPAHGSDMCHLTMLPHRQMDYLFDAAAEAVEEAIINAMTAAETTVGYNGRTAPALPLDRFQELMRR